MLLTVQMAPDYDAYTHLLTGLTDDEIDAKAKDIIWLAEFGPEDSRHTYALKRNMIVAECERRGRADIIERVRKRWDSGIYQW